MGFMFFTIMGEFCLEVVVNAMGVYIFGKGINEYLKAINKHIDSGETSFSFLKLKLSKKDKYSHKLVKLPKRLTKKLSDEEIYEVKNSIDNKHIRVLIDGLKRGLAPNSFDIALNNLLNNLDSSKEANLAMKNIYCMLGVAGFIDQPKKENGKFIYNLGDGTPIELFAVDDVSIHELLHLASSRYNPETKKFNCGFRYGKIGRALNEGYTEHLRKKHFIKKSNLLKPTYGYQISEKFSNILEQIVDANKMETSYFNADLKELLGYMQKYISYDEAYNFVKNMDYLVIPYLFEFLLVPNVVKQIGINMKVFNELESKFLTIIKNIEVSLMKMYINKQKKLVEDMTIDIDNAYSNILEFYNKNFVELLNMNLLSEKEGIFNQKYNLCQINEEELQELISCEMNLSIQKK